MILLNIEIAEQQTSLRDANVLSTGISQIQSNAICDGRFNCAPNVGQQNGGNLWRCAACELRGGETVSRHDGVRDAQATSKVRAEDDRTSPCLGVWGSGWSAPDLLRYPVAQVGFGLLFPSFSTRGTRRRRRRGMPARQDGGIGAPKSRMDCD
jgi:hypothetical protein